MSGFKRSEFPCIGSEDKARLEEYFLVVQGVFADGVQALSSLKSRILDGLGSCASSDLFEIAETASNDYWIKAAREWMDKSKFFFNPFSPLQDHRDSLREEGLQEIIAEISQIRRRIWRYIEHYEALSKGSSSGIFRRVDLKTTIDNVIKFDQARYRSQYSVCKITISIGEINLEVDYQRFITALGEIIRNALFSTLKYSELGRRKIFYGLRDSSSINIVAEVVDGRIILRIVDNGIGIPAENLQKIKHYGVSISDRGVQFGGLGVGLPTSITTFEEMGGTLALESSLSTGTTVTIQLPIA